MAQFEIIQTEADANQELGVEEARNQVEASRLALLQLLALDLSNPVKASDTPKAEPLQINELEAQRLALEHQPDYLQPGHRGRAGGNQSDRGAQQQPVGCLVGERRESGAGPVQWRIRGPRQSELAKLCRHSDRGSHRQRLRHAPRRSAGESQRGHPGCPHQGSAAATGARGGKCDPRCTVALAPVRDCRARDLSKKLEFEREKLQAGRSSNFQVLSFETDLRNAENARLNALIGYLNAQTELDQRLGMTLKSWDIALND